MAQSSARTKAGRAAPAKAVVRARRAGVRTRTYRISDVVVIKKGYGLKSSGLVLVLDGFRPLKPESVVGQMAAVTVRGGFLGREIADVRDHGAKCSILLEDWDENFPPPAIGQVVKLPCPWMSSPTA